jgi:IclR family transcriptional regulator, KDG regulon repressor
LAAEVNVVRARPPLDSVGEKSLRSGTPRRIQVLDRALRALETLADAPGGLGVTELGRRLGVDKSTAHRLLATFVHRGYVRVDPRTQRYLLGIRLVGLGASAWRGVDLAETARPVLETLRDESGEAAHLAVLMDGEAVFLAKASAPGALTVNVGVGSRAPVHCTSLGKALLAWLAEPELHALLSESTFPRFTARTITDAEDLTRHLKLVRERGWALDDEERDVGLRCLAAPVRDAGELVIAAVGISGPAARVTLDRVDALAEQVVAAALAVSAGIGHRSIEAPQSVGIPVR